ncbi:MAG: hypothetical protein AAF581_10280 [Planctomycetota bacterium]
MSGKRSSPTVLWLVIGVLLLAGLLGLWLWLGWHVPKDMGGGAWGDQFGAVNALFSGLALGGVVVAILLQSRELSLQRREITLAREEQEQQSRIQGLAAEATARTALLEGAMRAMEAAQNVRDEILAEEHSSEEDLRKLGNKLDVVLELIATHEGELEEITRLLAVERSNSS